MNRSKPLVIPPEPERIPAVCPCTGLTIRHRPDWVYTNPEQTYRTTIALIADNIFWVIPRGYVTGRDMEQAVAMSKTILAETIPGGDPFVFIENFANTRGGTSSARRLYLQFTNSLDGLLGSFPYGMPPFFRLSFNFSRRLRLHRYKVHMVARYDDAVTAAVALLDQNGSPPLSPSPGLMANRTELGDESTGTCRAADIAAESDSITGLNPHVDKLLSYLGSLDLESTGLPAFPEDLRGGTMQPVYEALELLKMDMDQFLEEHQSLVVERKARQHELVKKTETIESRNRQLQLLLHQSSEDQRELGEIVLNNVQTLLKPIMRLIEEEAHHSDQRGWINGLNSRIDELVKDLSAHLDLRRYRLTPQEIRVARLIRSGARTKTIADQLGVSVRTVETFRGRLREKLGIKGRRRNLRTALLVIPDEPVLPEDDIPDGTEQRRLDP